MYEMMLNRKNSKKGFTLVEVIVVLVILAILAAIMIPAMTGWIDEARNKRVLVEARSALLAAQTLASEEYGKTTPDYEGNVTPAKIAALADLDSSKIGAPAITKGKVTSIVYDGYTWSSTTQEWTKN